MRGINPIRLGRARRVRLASAATATACLTLSISAQWAGAQVNSWIGGNGNWSDAADWSLGYAPGGENFSSGVEINGAAGNSATCTYYGDSEGDFFQTIGINSNATLVLAPNPDDPDQVPEVQGYTLSVGTSGNGYINASAGYLGWNGFGFAGGGLIMGDGATGTLSVSDEAHFAAAPALLGDANSGTGAIYQSGGTTGFGSSSGNIVVGLTLGNSAGTSGIYQLSGGSISAFSEVIGSQGAGTFVQIGGTNSIIPGTKNPRFLFAIAASSGSTGNYDLSGGSLSISGNAYVGGIDPADGGSGGTGVLTVEGTGAMTVSQTVKVYNTPGTSVNLAGGSITTAALDLSENPSLLNWTAGTLNVTGVGGLTIGPTGNLGSTTLSPEKTLNVSNTLTIQSGGLLIMPGGQMTVGGLLINPGGTLDVANSHFIIDYAGGSDPIAAIASYLQSGYNNGAWNGPGIISSAAQTPTNGFEYGIGYADGADGIVPGLSSGQIEIKYTLLGDANLDGTVNGSDFSILAANFGLGATNWDQGNFLYGFSVNGSDFSALAANFGQGDSGAAVSVSPADIAALDSFAVANNLPLPAFANVPEPACGALLATAIIGAFRRRRRR